MSRKAKFTPEEKEQAVIEVERKLRKEYQEQLRSADREIAVLQAKLEEK